LSKVILAWTLIKESLNWCSSVRNRSWILETEIHNVWNFLSWASVWNFLFQVSKTLKFFVILTFIFQQRSSTTHNYWSRIDIRSDRCRLEPLFLIVSQRLRLFMSLIDLTLLDHLHVFIRVYKIVHFRLHFFLVLVISSHLKQLL